MPKDIHTRAGELLRFLAEHLAARDYEVARLMLEQLLNRSPK